MRAALPNTSVCEKFFQISEEKMIHSVLKRKVKTGREVKNQSVKNMIGDEEKEKKRYNRKRRVPTVLYSWGREFIWKFGKWKTKELDFLLTNIVPMYYLFQFTQLFTWEEFKSILCDVQINQL